ncbi:MAG: NTP transferase domain-containing protein [Akkermansia sp.]|nr:NTP transferase domain-containing protein [Akkermansia sp.]MBQ8376359.1 NTP transferase domain-containing protein [Akkermansia sp.]
MSNTKSIILSCAGIGSRLGLGKTKALMDICGRSLISWQLEFFKDVEDLRIVVGYQASDVIEEVRKYRSDAIFVYNRDYFHTKTGYSYYLGAKDANQLCIEWDGDLLVHPDDVKKLLSEPSEFIAYSDKTSDDAVMLSTNNKGEVVGFSRSSGDWEWTGPCCLKKNKILKTDGHVYNILEQHLPIKGIHIRAQDIDTYEDYQRALEFISKW